MSDSYWLVIILFDSVAISGFAFNIGLDSLEPNTEKLSRQILPLKTLMLFSVSILYVSYNTIWHYPLLFSNIKQLCNIQQSKTIFDTTIFDDIVKYLAILSNICPYLISISYYRQRHNSSCNYIKIVMFWNFLDNQLIN